MKFLYFTDTHIRGNTPVSRTDVFEDTLKRKIEEVHQIGLDESVDFYIHGGDLFDRPDVSVRTVGEFGTLFQKFEKTIFIISGNHNIYGHNPNTLGRSMLGLLTELDVFKIIHKNDPLVIQDGNLRIQISGSPYIYNIDGENKDNYHPKRLDNIDYHILLIHSLLLDKPFIETIDYSLIENIQDENIDLVLSGHYHTGFGQIKYRNTLFVNPGSLVRISSTKPERNRIPQVAIIEFGKTEIKCKLIPLKSAKPGEEVLDEKRDDTALKKSNIESFKLLMRQNLDIDNYNIKDMLLKISTKEKIPQNIVEMALERLAEAEDSHEKNK